GDHRHLQDPQDGPGRRRLRPRQDQGPALRPRRQEGLSEGDQGRLRQDLRRNRQAVAAPALSLPSPSLRCARGRGRSRAAPPPPLPPRSGEGEGRERVGRGKTSPSGEGKRKGEGRRQVLYITKYFIHKRSIDLNRAGTM